MSMSQPTTTVRELELSDMVGIAQCILIDADTFPYAGVTFGFRPASAHVWAARGDESQRVLGGGDGEVLGRVLGFIACVVRGREQYIEALAVERASRRRGIGRSLLQASMAHARHAHLETVRLHVWVGNRAAVELYRSSGFTERRRVQRFYRKGLFGSTDDAYEMAWLVGGGA